ncbi:hypothetical protein ACFLT2_02100 [Acidobacteriota bacterium]
MNDNLYKRGHKDRVPKIAYLRDIIQIRLDALVTHPGEQDFYFNRDDYSLTDVGKVKRYDSKKIIKLKREDIEEELKYAVQFLNELQLPVNDGWGGSHCCMYGVILIKC